MAKAPKNKEEPEGNPERGDEILKRHAPDEAEAAQDMVEERKAKRGPTSGARRSDYSAMPGTA